MFCKNCGKEVSAKSEFCKQCGTRIVAALARSYSVVPEITASESGSAPAPSTDRGWIKGIIQMLVAVLVIAFVAGVIASVSSEDDSTSPGLDDKSETTLSASLQEQIAATVVNIICTSNDPADDEYTSGSGTIISGGGVIFTNVHVIPQERGRSILADGGCLIVLPHPGTGEPSEMYYADLLEMSTQYDLAILAVREPVYDEDTETLMGYDDRVFPAFDDVGDICFMSDIRLGESVRIFGYPGISGGSTLTVTDGIVSSFPGDGYIVTSAKLSHGNSGGLAVNRNGCMIGVPTLVNFDEAESLGYIVSSDVVMEFLREALDVMDRRIKAAEAEE